MNMEPEGNLSPGRDALNLVTHEESESLELVWSLVLVQALDIVNKVKQDHILSHDVVCSKVCC